MKKNFLTKLVAVVALIIGSQMGMQAQQFNSTLSLERASFAQIDALTQTLTPSCSPVVYNEVAGALQTWDGTKWKLDVSEMTLQERQTFQTAFNALTPTARQKYRDIMVFDPATETFHKIQTQTSGVFQPVQIAASIPHLNTAEIIALNPAQDYTVFNTDAKCFFEYISAQGIWRQTSTPQMTAQEREQFQTLVQDFAQVVVEGVTVQEQPQRDLYKEFLIFDRTAKCQFSVSLDPANQSLIVWNQVSTPQMSALERVAFKQEITVVASINIEALYHDITIYDTDAKSHFRVIAQGASYEVKQIAPVQLTETERIAFETALQQTLTQSITLSDQSTITPTEAQLAELYQDMIAVDVASDRYFKIVPEAGTILSTMSFAPMAIAGTIPHLNTVEIIALSPVFDMTVFNTDAKCYFEFDAVQNAWRQTSTPHMSPAERVAFETLVETQLTTQPQRDLYKSFNVFDKVAKCQFSVSLDQVNQTSVIWRQSSRAQMTPAERVAFETNAEIIALSTGANGERESLYQDMVIYDSYAKTEFRLSDIASLKFKQLATANMTKVERMNFHTDVAGLTGQMQDITPTQAQALYNDLVIYDEYARTEFRVNLENVTSPAWVAITSPQMTTVEIQAIRDELVAADVPLYQDMIIYEYDVTTAIQRIRRLEYISGDTWQDAELTAPAAWDYRTNEEFIKHSDERPFGIKLSNMDRVYIGPTAFTALSNAPEGILHIVQSDDVNEPILKLDHYNTTTQERTNQLRIQPRFNGTTYTYLEFNTNALAQSFAIAGELTPRLEIMDQATPISHTPSSPEITSQKVSKITNVTELPVQEVVRVTTGDIMIEDVTKGIIMKDALNENILYRIRVEDGNIKAVRIQ